MSYTSKTFNQTWDFNPDGDDLAAKTGRMLHTGVFGRNNNREWKEPAPVEAPKKSFSVGASPSTTDKSEPTATGPIVANPPKYVWVDPKGRTIRESGATTGNFTLPPKEDHSWTKAQFDTHSSHLWSRVNPGLIKDYMGAPPSTMKHHFPEHPEDKQKDFEHHLKKTDYSEYTEARAKYAIPAGVSGGGGGGGKADNIFRVPGKCVERFDLFPEPDGGSKANMVAYSTSTKFWETVLNKKTY